VLLLLRTISPRLPGALVVLALGIFAVGALDLPARGVAVIPPVPSGLPGFSAPDLALVEHLMQAAVGIALMCFVESIAAARAFVRKEDAPLDADQELRALGAANLSGGLFQAFPAGGGLSQTAVNDGNGARSQLAGAVTAIFVVVTMLFLTALLENLAEATLGAVVLVAVLGLLDLAVVVSVLRLIYEVIRMPIRVLGRNPKTGSFDDVDSHPEVTTTPGLVILKPEGGLYFANARQVVDRMRSLAVGTGPAVSVLLVDMSAVPDLETTAALVLDEFASQLEESGIELWLSRLTVRPLEMLGRTGTLDRLEGRQFRTVADAVARFEGTSGPGERGIPGRVSPGG
jgi:MFS superfamily sulfate permease-like transporter